MKKYIALLVLAIAAVILPVAQSGCATPPSARVVQVQTLKAVGQAADAAVSLTAHLYGNHLITAAQAQKVMAIYDGQFQPAFRLAVAAVNSDLSPASADLADLAAQLTALVASYQKP